MLKSYISNCNTFSLQYPDDWKLEKENDGTIKLSRLVGLFKKESPYPLRITPLVSDEIISPQAYTALLTIRRKQHRDLEVIEADPGYVMNFHILKYKKEVYEDAGKRTFLMINDYWELIISNRIFTCWIGAKQGEEETAQFKEERAVAEIILHTIKLL